MSVNLLSFRAWITVRLTVVLSLLTFSAVANEALSLRGITTNVAKSEFNSQESVIAGYMPEVNKDGAYNDGFVCSSDIYEPSIRYKIENGLAVRTSDPIDGLLHCAVRAQFSRHRELEGKYDLAWKDVTYDFVLNKLYKVCIHKRENENVAGKMWEDIQEKYRSANTPDETATLSNWKDASRFIYINHRVKQKIVADVRFRKSEIPKANWSMADHIAALFKENKAYQIQICLIDEALENKGNQLRAIAKAKWDDKVSKEKAERKAQLEKQETLDEKFSM